MTTRNGNLFESGTGRIAGVVAAVPANTVTNAGWQDALDAEKITGVRERRQARSETTTEWLCTQAALALLNDLGWARDSITALVFVTQSPEGLMPAGAYSIHEMLDLPQSCDVVQVNWACSGYVHGLKLAQKLATNNTTSHRVLLLVGDVTSKQCDPADRATFPLFGDAGSATAVEFDPFSQDFFITGVDGSNNKRLSQAHGELISMDGPTVFGFTLAKIPSLVRDAMTLTPKPDRLLFHQANKFILEHLVKKIGLLPEFEGCIPMNVDRFGNCSSASIPLLMVSELRKELMAGPMRLCLFGFGAGWAWGAASVFVPPLKACRLLEV